MPDDRAVRLQALTAALSAAVSPETVARAIIDQALPALGAIAGNVYLLDEGAGELVSIAAVGYDPGVLEDSRRLPLHSSTMMAEVVRGGEPILFATWQERLSRFPHHRDVHAQQGDRSVAGLPLRVEGRILGALSLAFPTDRDFSASDRRFMATVADLCAQALERARLHRSLEESEQRFRQLADVMPQIAWVIKGDGATLEFLNQRWFDYTGVDRGLNTAADANAPIHPNDRPLAERRWVEAIKSGIPFESEMRLRGADGHYRWFLTRCVPVHDSAGRISRWFGTSTDIDDHKRVQASQRFLADLGNVLGVSLDVEETLWRVARRAVPDLADYCFVDMLGPEGAIERLAWSDLDAEEETRLTARWGRGAPLPLAETHPVRRTLATGTPQFLPEVTPEWLERMAFSPEHREFLSAHQIRSQMTVPLIARGRTLGAFTFFVTGESGRQFTQDHLRLARDMAERVAVAVDNARLYAEARAAEAKVSRLLDAGIVGVIVVDDQHILEANNHFLTFTGYTRADITAHRLRWRELTPPEFAELDARGVAELEQRGVCTPFEKEYFRRDGSRVPILIGAAELQADPPRWICFVLDLTERKRAEDEWRAFVDATAHDLRNPLTSILGQTQILQRRLRRDGLVSRDDLEMRSATVVSAVNRAAGLIDELIDTARLQAGQPLDLRPSAVDLMAMVITCVEEARRAGPSRQVRLERTTDELIATVDGPRIERVFRNILDNALKYSPGGEDVLIRVSREEDDVGAWAVLVVADRGVGISAADLLHVFDRFHRGENVAGSIAGSGIGLTGARQIVEEHGGTIGIASTVGVGSTFTVRLPLLPLAS